MLNLIVLGYVPGTHIEITFNFLLATFLLFSLPMIISLINHIVFVRRRAHQLLAELISL